MLLLVNISKVGVKVKTTKCHTVRMVLNLIWKSYKKVKS